MKGESFFLSIFFVNFDLPIAAVSIHCRWYLIISNKSIYYSILAGDKRLSRWRSLTTDILSKNVIPILTGYKRCRKGPFHLSALNTISLQHSDLYRFLIPSHLLCCTVRSWIYWLIVWCFLLDVVSGGVFGYKAPIPHSLQSFQHLREVFLDVLILFRNLWYCCASQYRPSYFASSLENDFYANWLRLY